MDRNEARQHIREVAGRRRQITNIKMAGLIGRSKGRRADLQPLPKIEQAVRIVRQHRLVDNDVLVAAGFNPYPEELSRNR